MADRPVRGFGVAAGLDADIGAEVARRCAAHGYASLWSNDHPMASGLETAAVFAAGGSRAGCRCRRAGTRPAHPGGRGRQDR